MQNEKRLITAALPYANGPLHFGHIAGAYLPADCYARFQRLLHRDVLFLCGSDEYGVAITMSAEIAGRTPQAHVDIYHQVIKDFFKTLNISFDHYARTSAKGHIAPVQKFFLDLLEKGLIEARETDQLYSEKEQRFLADRYVTGLCPRCGFAEARGDECPSCGASYEATDLKEPRSKLTGSPLIKKRTKHWFLLLEKSQKELTDWLATKNWKSNVVNFVKGYIDELHARAITRDSEWGFRSLCRVRKEKCFMCGSMRRSVTFLQPWSGQKSRVIPTNGRITGAILQRSLCNLLVRIISLFMR